MIDVATTGSTNFTYSWSPAVGLSDPTSQTPTASPEFTTIYEVTVTDDNGCTATSSVPLKVINLLCKEPYIFIPKAFTPNNDNNNDRFRVRGENIEELLFVVYDRWGEEMYKTTDPNHLGWDGTFDGHELTPDAYGWYVRVLCVNGEEYVRKGRLVCNAGGHIRRPLP